MIARELAPVPDPFEIQRSKQNYATVLMVRYVFRDPDMDLRWVLVGSLLALIYIWRVVEVAYLQEPPEGQTVTEAPLSMLIPTWILIGASIYFGIDTSLSAGVAETAARLLLQEAAP